MKRLLALIVLMLAMNVRSEDTLLPMIKAGFDAYASKGMDAAWLAWHVDYGEKTEETKARLAAAVKDAQKTLGGIVGFEIIRAIEISPSYRHVYVLWRFENHPLFCKFSCYRARTEWKVIQLGLGGTAAEYLPPSVMEGLPPAK